MARDRVAAYLTGESSRLGRSVVAIMSDLDRLHALVDKWQAVQNLVSRETPGEFWTRHVLDSLQILPLLDAADHVVDLGSGGGFPALPVAIATKGRAIHFDLVESNGRKCAFLNAVRREIVLEARAHNTRIERFATRPPDVITARALAGLPILMTFARALAGPQTRLVLHKGRDYGEELGQLDSATRANVLRHPSLSGSDAVVLEWPAGTFGV